MKPPRYSEGEIELAIEMLYREHEEELKNALAGVEILGKKLWKIIVASGKRRR